MQGISRAQKTKIRARKAWKVFADRILNERKCCEICGADLTARFVRGRRAGKLKATPNVHHMHVCENEEQYENYDPSRFMLLCVSCHEWVHKIYNSPNFKDRRFYGREG